MRNHRRSTAENNLESGDSREFSGVIDKTTGRTVCPLQNVEIHAVIDTGAAEVTLTQKYINTSGHAIEALYTFPVPHDAQVTGFRCRVGGDEVTGEFREKEKAFREYDQAVRRGDSAFLLESHRPDIFQVSLGNIAAGEAASIVISYLEDVKIEDSELRWSVPTVVAPRYIPGSGAGHKTGPGTAQPTDQVPDADYITPPVGKTAYTLKIGAVLKGINGLKGVSSPSHPIEVSFDGGDARVSLARENEPLDSDFVICARIEPDKRNSYITGSESKGAFGSVGFYPELSKYYREPKPCEYVFLIDVSGSMGGEKLEQAKRALSISLRNLFEGDYFNIVAFESGYRSFSDESLPYSQQTLELADKWVASLNAMGGTEIYEPLRFVLEHSKGAKGLSRVVFLFTDGQVGNESQIISLVKQNSTSLQLYPFGIDTAVNRYFIDSLAGAGNGAPEYIYPGERIEDKVIRQFSRVHQPYLTELSVTDSNGRPLETVPPLPARLYDSEDLVFTFRTEAGDIPDKIKVRGTVDSEKLEFEMEREDIGDGRLLGLKWAKGRITELEQVISGSYERRNELVRKEIVDISMKYSVLSTLTSLVAVYSRKNKVTGLPQTVIVPVAAPRGWTMPMGPVIAYSTAPMCVTEACMRTYADQNEGFRGMYDVPEEADSVGMPSFLKKGRTVSGRSGFSRLLRKRTGKPVYSAGTETLGHEGDAGTTPIRTEGTEKDLHEMILTAAQLQNADGSFGSGDDALIRTSSFITGLLLSGDEWKPYRLQLIKAGEALMKLLPDAARQSSGLQADTAGRIPDSQADPDNPDQAENRGVGSQLSLASAALALLTVKGLLRRYVGMRSPADMVKGLPVKAANTFDAVLSGNLDQLPDPDGSVTSGIAVAGERAARYLRAAIHNDKKP